MAVPATPFEDSGRATRPLCTLDYLRREAATGRREDFDRFLAAVPDQEPIKTDRMPE